MLRVDIGFQVGTVSMSNESDELARLRAENARLSVLLESHDIDWRHDPAPSAPPGWSATFSKKDIPLTLFVLIFGEG